MGNCTSEPPPAPSPPTCVVAPIVVKPKETVVDLRFRRACEDLRLWNDTLLVRNGDEDDVTDAAMRYRYDEAAYNNYLRVKQSYEESIYDGYLRATQRYEEALDKWYDQELARCGRRCE